jgi:hypothetical protein
VNTAPIPRRRGVGNTPFVFCARGIRRLRFDGYDNRLFPDHHAQPQDVHEVDEEDADADASPTEDPDPEYNQDDHPALKREEDPDADAEDNFEHEHMDAEPKVVEDPLSLLAWNGPNAFAQHLKQVGYAQDEVGYDSRCQISMLTNF